MLNCLTQSVKCSGNFREEEEKLELVKSNKPLGEMKHDLDL